MTNSARVSGGFTGVCPAEKQRSAKKVEESRSLSRGESSRAVLSGARPLAAVGLGAADRGVNGLPRRGGLHVGRCNSPIPLPAPLSGVRARAGGCGTPDGVSERGRDGAAC